jgi:ribosome-binding ATPase YchF (GTP1/OBG family)
MITAKSAGKVRIEGKEYVMADGDVVESCFNVGFDPIYIPPQT